MKKRNPIAKAVTKIPPKVIPDKRSKEAEEYWDELAKEWYKIEAEINDDYGKQTDEESDFFAKEWDDESH